MSSDAEAVLRQEVAALKKRLREVENDAIEKGAILHWIQAALDGQDLCDFAESFPIVRAVVDLRQRAVEYESLDHPPW